MESDTVSETQPLTSLSSYSRSLRRSLTGHGVCLLPGCVWLLSKPVLAMIFINAVVGASNATMMLAALECSYPTKSVFIIMVCVCLFVAFISLFSPVSGFLADVRCGRHRVIFVSVCLMFTASLAVSLIAVFTLARIWLVNVRVYYHIVQPVTFVLAAIGLVLFMSGLTGYQANFVQFGLDQLLEAPSSSLALFIHWMVWAESLGALVIQILDALYVCNQWSNVKYNILPSVWALVLTVLLFVVILCLKKCGFYAEPQRHNPYKMICKVLGFTRKHKHPLQRSAFTYCDDERPSRLDFAKERYGGPFTTEQVEDVKTFFKIVLLLLALSPIFVLEIPSSIFVTAFFGTHTRDSLVNVTHLCTSRFILLERGAVNSLCTIVFLPLFMWVVFYLLQRRMLSILSRLIFAVVIHLLGVASMLCVDLAGHIVSEERSTFNATMCMFIVHHHHQPGGTLGLHWSVLLIPGLLLGLGPPLVIATTFEFISAQSPFAMKGLLVGVFFTIRAFFQLISALVLIPFANRPLWDSQSMKEHPPVTNCGFGYFLLTCIIAVVGLVLLSVAVKKYKHRERDDRPYDQRFAVDVYSRYLQ